MAHILPDRPLEERVAALEEMVAHPLQIVSAPPGNFSDAQVAELQEALDEVGKHGPYTHRILPSPPPLTSGQVRQLLRECVTVVKPGEVLVLRCPEDWTADQADYMQEHAARWLEENAPDIRAMVVPHLEMAVVQPEDDAAFIKRIERVGPELERREMRRMAANPSRRIG